MRTHLNKVINNKTSDIIRLMDEVKDSLIEEINSLEEDLKKEVENNDLLMNEIYDLEVKIEQLELRINNNQQPKIKLVK